MPDLTSNIELAERMGQLGTDTPMSGRANVRWDQRKDFVSDEHRDLGWIGEDAQGVWTRAHPIAALTEYPELWDSVAEWNAGIRDLSRSEFDSLSNFDYEARLTFAAAHSREEARRMKRPRDDDG